MAVVESLISARWIRLARTHQVHRPEAAAGRCFAVSLDLACALRDRLLAEPILLRWQVLDDPDYADHWAVLLDDERALDPTGVQIDGRAHLVRRLADYPGHLVGLRRYPLAVMAKAYAAEQDRGGDRLSLGFRLRALGSCMAHDLATRGVPWRRIVADALAQGRGLVLEALRRRLDARRAVLLRRLDEPANSAEDRRQSA